MKILHIPFSFPPDPVGGTEVYVEALAHQQMACGAQIIIAAPSPIARTPYSHKSLRVYRFTPAQTLNDVHEVYGVGDVQAAADLAQILDAEKPDIVHLHTFTRATTLRSLEQIRKRNIPLVFTYHLPGVSCQRGTLMRWGRLPCDGVLRLHTCASCVLHYRGLPQSASLLFGHTPVVFGKKLAMLGASGGLWTAMRMTELLDQGHAAFHTLMSYAENVIALCQWTRDLLLANGVAQEKIVVSPHGISWDQSATNGAVRESMSVTPERIPLRIAFLGRIAPIKGCDILIKALRQISKTALSLDLYSIVQNTGSEAYQQQMIELAQNDQRIRFLPMIPNDQVVATLGNYDLLAVPSQCLETGPLVALEAFAAGIPVLGSQLGGIAELIDHDVNGLLVQHNDIKTWATTLHRLATDPTLLYRLRAAVRPPRTMGEVADEMLTLYQSILSRRQQAA
jgi:glycosyltransferase involved in cell wall biosynthesis